MSEIYKKIAIIACLACATPALAAAGDTPTPSAAPGPKVHTSNVEDQSGCDKLADPKAAVLGRTIGAIAGVKLGAGMTGSYMAAAAAEEAAVKATTAGRCNATVDIGQAAQQPVQKLKNKIKIRIPGLGF